MSIYQYIPAGSRGWIWALHTWLRQLWLGTFFMDNLRSRAAPCSSATSKIRHGIILGCGCDGECFWRWPSPPKRNTTSVVLFSRCSGFSHWSITRTYYMYVIVCVCVHFQSTMLSISIKKSFFTYVWCPPKFSKSNEEYQDSPLNNCFLKGSHHQPIRTVHGRAMVQAAWPDSGCGDLWKNLLVDRLIIIFLMANDFQTHPCTMYQP